MSVQALIHWIERQPALRLVFAEADQAHVLQTEPRPLLELVLVLRGRFTLEVGALKQEVGPGDIAWINAHHGNRAELAGTNARYACVSLDVSEREEFRQFARQPVLELMRGPRLEWSVQAFGEVVRWHRATADPLRDIMLKAGLIRLLGNLALARDAPGGATRPARLLRALAIIDQNSADPTLSIDAIARAAGVSHSTLRRMFLEHLKMAPIEYLQDLRLARAHDFLAKTALGVKEIAAQVGYADPLYFSRAFRRRYGRPPSALQQFKRKPELNGASPRRGGGDSKNRSF